VWESLIQSKLGAGLGAGVGSALAGDGGPFAGGDAAAAAYGTKLDGSGWSVNFGSGALTSTSSPNTSEAIPASPLGSEQVMQAGASLPVWAMLIIGAAILYRAMKKGGR